MPNKQNLYILGTYRPPSSSIVNFNEKFFTLLNQVIGSKKCLIAGDFNVNTMSHNLSTAEANFLDNIITDGYTPLINIPTRVTNQTSTCIDHFYSNMQEETICGVTNLGITDHYLIFCVIKTINKIYDKKKQLNSGITQHVISNS